MPPRKRPASDTYEADDGFVEDAPKSKKTKAIPQSKSGGKTAESENEYWEVSFPSSQRLIHVDQIKTDIHIQLGRTRRVQINEFKGKQLVDIREFYEKDDHMLPGKKVCPRSIYLLLSLRQVDIVLILFFLRESPSTSNNSQLSSSSCRRLKRRSKPKASLSRVLNTAKRVLP